MNSPWKKGVVNQVVAGRSTKGQMFHERRSSIRQLSTAEAGPAGALLGRTFAAEAWRRDLLPDEDERLRFCTLLYTANVRWSRHRGSVWGIEASPGILGGVLTLLDCPYPEMTAAEATAYGFDPVESEWPDLLSAFDALERPAVAALRGLPEPWCYVNVLGIDPAWQGRGLGTSLMRHAIARAEAAGLPMGLLTGSARNVRFYERLGFRTILEGTETEPIRLWAMTRTAPGPQPRDPGAAPIH